MTNPSLYLKITFRERTYILPSVPPSLEDLQSALGRKLLADPSELREALPQQTDPPSLPAVLQDLKKKTFWFRDSEGDNIILNDDEDLQTITTLAESGQSRSVKVFVKDFEHSPKESGLIQNHQNQELAEDGFGKKLYEKVKEQFGPENLLQNSLFDKNLSSGIPCEHCLGVGFESKIIGSQIFKSECPHCCGKGFRPMTPKWNLILKMIEHKIQNYLLGTLEAALGIQKPSLTPSYQPSENLPSHQSRKESSKGPNYQTTDDKRPSSYQTLPNMQEEGQTSANDISLQKLMMLSPSHPMGAGLASQAPFQGLHPNSLNLGLPPQSNSSFGFPRATSALMDTVSQSEILPPAGVSYLPYQQAMLLRNNAELAAKSFSNHNTESCYTGSEANSKSIENSQNKSLSKEVNLAIDTLQPLPQPNGQVATPIASPLGANRSPQPLASSVATASASQDQSLSLKDLKKNPLAQQVQGDSSLMTIGAQFDQAPLNSQSMQDNRKSVTLREATTPLSTSLVNPPAENTCSRKALGFEWVEKTSSLQLQASSEGKLTFTIKNTNPTDLKEGMTFILSLDQQTRLSYALQEKIPPKATGQLIFDLKEFCSEPGKKFEKVTLQLNWNETSPDGKERVKYFSDKIKFSLEIAG